MAPIRKGDMAANAAQLNLSIGGIGFQEIPVMTRDIGLGQT